MKIQRAYSFVLLIILCRNPVAADVSHARANPDLSADQRSELVMAQMTQAEKFKLVLGFFGAEISEKGLKKHPEALANSAGFVEGVARLGIPALVETDGGIGVATQSSGKNQPRERTALPSGLAVAATWNPQLAYQSGAMIGSEARASGFNVLLGGAVNLIREPRNGRNFEYAGEDPWLAGVMVAQQIKGIESNHLIATMKHFALNGQETGRFVLDARIAETAARMSDLLAMQFVIEQADPGAVMCAYNRVNGIYACENEFLLNTLLKKEWRFRGFVMSDWGATHSAAAAANSGLDQESGWEFDSQPFFSDALRSAVQQGVVPQSRLDDMVRRILRSMFAKGLIDYPVREKQAIDFAVHEIQSRSAAEEGMVLLKNSRHILPLSENVKHIIVIGAHADVGVLSGGGSSQVYPIGGMAVQGLEPSSWPGPVVYFPSSPLQHIQAQVPHAEVYFYDGSDSKLAAQLAAHADVAIVFAEQWIGEANDARSLALPDQQDELIDAVASANPKTIVVLETGGPVTMPWIKKVGAVLEAWYPGTRGGEAIARILFGAVNPSGRLPVTFAQAEAQLVRPNLDGDRAHENVPFEVNYWEGAAVGYKWFDLTQKTPLFPFGFGLSYTDFAYSNLSVACHETRCQLNFTVTNDGKRNGKDVAQVYVLARQGEWEAPKRLVAWEKLALSAGQSKQVNLSIDPRLLAVIDIRDHLWHIRAGHYQLIVAHHANDSNPVRTDLYLADRTLTLQGRAAQ